MSHRIQSRSPLLRKKKERRREEVMCRRNKVVRSLTNQVRMMRGGLSLLRLGQVGGTSFISCVYTRPTREGTLGGFRTGLNGGMSPSENMRRTNTRRAAQKEGWVFSSAGTSMSLRRIETTGIRERRNPISRESQRLSEETSGCSVRRQRHPTLSDICTRTRNMSTPGGTHPERRN